ncbi:MAG: acylglycerol kinase family protein [Chitinophagaceae bacterium]|nr:acylglycerol kinase family protein [Chitinophagaceae bacterium]
MRRKIVFLLNPIAGGKNKSRVRQVIETWANRSGLDFEIQVTNAEGDYGLLRRKIADERITDIVIAGGDGTINSVVDALRDTGVCFGIIPMGSGNGLALTAGIPKNPRKALDLVLHGKPTATDAFIINEKFSCMLSGIGFDAQVAHDFARQERRGLATYV